MKKIFECRRSSIALIGICALVFISYSKGYDVSMAISTIVMAIAGANAYEKKGSSND